jgi:CRP/FNR family transcriptional regulator
MEQGYDKSRLGELHVLVAHTGPYSGGRTHLSRRRSVRRHRRGTRRHRQDYVTDSEGREQVQGFFLPGEVIGLNAISSSRYPCNAVALDPVMLCRFSFPDIAALATRMPGLQQHLFRLLSQDIGKAALLAGNFTADERLAAFLVSLSRRYAARGFSRTRFRLTMTRTDIANYLRLASESVSRGFRRLQDTGIVAVDRREIELRDRPGSRPWPAASCGTESNTGFASASTTRRSVSASAGWSASNFTAKDSRSGAAGCWGILPSSAPFRCPPARW